MKSLLESNVFSKYFIDYIESIFKRTSIHIMVIYIIRGK